MSQETLIEQEKQPQELVSVHDFFFEKWLYETITFWNFEEDIFNWEVDWYSHINHIDTTYSIGCWSNKIILRKHCKTCPQNYPKIMNSY